MRPRFKDERESDPPPGEEEPDSGEFETEPEHRGQPPGEDKERGR
jgi:hypothetical protein